MNTINKLYTQDNETFNNFWMYTEQKKMEKKQSKQLRKFRQTKRQTWDIQNG